MKASAPHDRALGVKHPDDVNQPLRRQSSRPAPVNPSGASQSLRVSRRAPRSRAGPHLRLPSTPSSMSGWTRRPYAPSSCPKPHTMPKSRSLRPTLARARLISVVCALSPCMDAGANAPVRGNRRHLVVLVLARAEVHPGGRCSSAPRRPIRQLRVAALVGRDHTIRHLLDVLGGVLSGS